MPDAEWSNRSDKPCIVIGTMLHAILEPEDKYPAAGLWSTPLNFAGRAWPPSEAKPEEISVSWKTRFTQKWRVYGFAMRDGSRVVAYQEVAHWRRCNRRGKTPNQIDA